MVETIIDSLLKGATNIQYFTYKYLDALLNWLAVPECGSTKRLSER